MELLGWILIAAVSLLVLASWAWWALQRTRRGREILGLSQRERLDLARWMLKDEGSPPIARSLVALLVAYLALPLDLIPDFIPIIGHLDDFVVTMAIVMLIVWVMPAERLDVGIAAARMNTINHEHAEPSPERHAPGGPRRLATRAAGAAATGLAARRISRRLRRR